MATVRPLAAWFQIGHTSADGTGVGSLLAEAKAASAVRIRRLLLARRDVRRRTMIFGRGDQRAGIQSSFDDFSLH